MAQNDSATLTAARGYIYVGAVGATMPTPAEIDSFTPGGTFTGFTTLGHTSRDDLPEFGFDGGDTETRGSWQNEALRQVTTEASVDYVTFTALQVDEPTLELYYGQANASATAGVFGVASAPTGGVEKSLLIVIQDGGTNVGFYANKASITREGALATTIDNFATLPMRATFLKNGNADLFDWISLDTGVNPAP